MADANLQSFAERLNSPYPRKSSADSIKSKDAQGVTSVGRTRGDGMENTVIKKIDLKENRIRLGNTLIYHPSNFKQVNSKPPVTPSGTVISLIPKSTTYAKKEKYILDSLKLKKPKFVPYEPYKAAVTPIIPFKNKYKRSLKNNVGIDAMVSHSVTLRADSKIRIIELDKNRNPFQEENYFDKNPYTAEIQTLKQENSQLENQLKFQTQVNAELKNLLVAAVGEDLETRVHLLTEDKLQLSQALLNSAKHLSTHQEQIEWLAGQCEVWRSKFLASSLIVEELARWKAALSQRTTDLQESIRRLLEEHNQIRDTSMKTYRTLSILRENFAPFSSSSSKPHKLTSTNILILAEGCCQISELLKIQLLSGMDKISLRKEIDVTGLEMRTVAEKNAEQFLTYPNVLMCGRQDVACSAVMGAAVALEGQRFFPRNPASTNVTCCSHCRGGVKEI